MVQPDSVQDSTRGLANRCLVLTQWRLLRAPGPASRSNQRETTRNDPERGMAYESLVAYARGRFARFGWSWYSFRSVTRHQILVFVVPGFSRAVPASKE